MAATFTWKEYNGAIGTATTATNLNFGSIDQANIATPANYPIAAGENSFEKYVKVDIGGTFTKVDNFRFYLSAGSVPTNDHIYFNGQVTSYTQPTESTSTVATVDVPTSEPGSANISIGGNLSGSITSAGTTDYAVLQVSTDSAQSAGQKGTFTFTTVYDEI